MLGEFINRILVLILAFAFPAFECFKAIESNRVDIEQLRFWCQYWIIVAVLSIIERFGDMFISWIPLYGELKLAFIIYLWYPKTKGTNYVYESLLRPFVSRHETDIDNNLQDLRYRIWDLALYYGKNCTELGQGAFFQVVQYMLNQSSRLRGGGGSSSSSGATRSHDMNDDHGQPRSPPPPAVPADFVPVLPPLHSAHNNRNSYIPPASPLRNDNRSSHIPPASPSRNDNRSSHIPPASPSRNDNNRSSHFPPAFLARNDNGRGSLIPPASPARNEGGAVRRWPPPPSAPPLPALFRTQGGSGGAT